MSSPDGDFDVSNESSVVSLTIAKQATEDDNDFTVGSGQAVTLQTITVGTAGEDLDVLAASSVTSLTLNVDAVGTKTTDVDVDVEGTGIATLNLASSGTASYFSLQNTGAAITKIVATGSKDVAIDLDVDSNAGDIDGVVTTFDASGATGGYSVTFEDDTAVKDLSVTGGSGDDVFDMGAALTKDDTISGGNGTDTLVVDDASDITDIAAADLKVSSIETVRLTEAASAAFTTFAASGYKTIDYRIAAAGSGGATDVTEGTAVTISGDGNAITHTVKDATNSANTTNAVTVTIDNGTDDADTDVTTLQLDGIETINLVSKGVASNNTQADFLTLTDTTNTINVIGTLTDAKAKTINISGATDIGVATSGGTLTALTAVDATSLTGRLSFVNRSTSSTTTTITGGTGADEITGRSTKDSILGAAGNDSLLGGGGNDTISGGDGNDTITTNSGSDVVNGDAGDDTITGSTGNDSLLGGDGNDVFVVSNADWTTIITSEDTIDGGTGTDAIQFDTDTTLDFTGQQATLTALTGIEKIIVDAASATVTLDDTLLGVANNTLEITNTTTVGVLAGTLAINASGVLSSTSRVNTSVQATTAGIVTYTLGNGIDNVDLSNSSGANIVQASTFGFFGANDTLKGGSGTDDELRFSHTSGQTLTAANLANLSGFEEIFVTAASGAYTFTVTDAIVAVNSDANALLEIGHSAVTNDGKLKVDASALGATYAVSVLGGSGNDTILGGAGNDTLNPGDAGVDSLVGGDGTTDWLDLGDVSYTGDDGVIVNVSGESKSITSSVASGGYGISSGLLGEQTESIATGTFAVYDNAAVAVVNVSTISGFEKYLLDGAGANLFWGSSSSESVTGGAGADKLMGGAGNDTLSGAASTDSLVGGDGNDNLSGGDGADTISGGAGNDTLTFGNDQDSVTGGSGNDTFVIDDANGADGDEITDFTVASDIIDLATNNATGTAVGYEELATGAINGDTGLVVYTGDIATVNAAGIEDLFDTTTSNYAFAAASDVIYLAADDGTDTYIWKLTAAAGNTEFTAAEDTAVLLVKLTGVSDATTLVYTNFSDFTTAI